MVLKSEQNYQELKQINTELEKMNKKRKKAERKKVGHQMKFESWLYCFYSFCCTQIVLSCLYELLQFPFNEIAKRIKKLEKNNSKNKKNFNKTIKKTSRLKKLVQTEKSIEQNNKKNQIKKEVLK
ncbi:hypothetical protein H7685_001070 [Candidatus Phytoplasma australasiaticum subsp. australasiaticum]|uniref:Transmembrane protein n=1 Tax=Candidatus Phytoplasma australasiaticum subsp. australasiaticum TaxID=2832407 RepID=A0A9K3SU08_9MOLU|nr:MULTISPECIES: hypothetical protein [Phytoplasma]MDO8054594.1 hypothetical protein [Candidatus Phytoplasma australasiaticum]MDO8058810.1 hypothetical protein [Candidatus Phytoplasma australasiaticum]UQV26932.1 hypothetical protein H7685_001070 ['Parthenium sp.' phyllody phytoplasma]